MASPASSSHWSIVVVVLGGDVTVVPGFQARAHAVDRVRKVVAELLDLVDRVGHDEEADAHADTGDGGVQDEDGDAAGGVGPLGV